MKTPDDIGNHAPPLAGGQSAAPQGDQDPHRQSTTMGGWIRALQWLGLGSLGAANPAPGNQHCAPGCVRKPADHKRRKRLTVARGPRLRPRPQQLMPATSAAGALARKSKQVLEKALLWLSP